MKTLSIGLLIAVMSICLSSCAVMFGSSNYNAKIKTDDPDASIYYNNAKIGTGEAQTTLARKNAKNIQLTIKKDGCDDQVVNYNTATLRGWSITGTVITWGLIGIAVDGGTGAWWKPNVDEQGVSKVDYKNYTYEIKYEGCKSNVASND